MLKTDILQPILAGNIGIPFSEKVFEELKNPDLGNIYILEISSFQLEFIEQFRAMICVYLNISPDHLDRHENMDKYLKIKLKMIKNHKEDDTVVYNIDDPVLDIAKELEAVALKDPYFVDRGLYPNVDFYSGIIYRALGIPTEMFTVMFALGRLPGWIAQWREMRLRKEPIGRPRQVYIGENLRSFVPLEKR